MPLLNYTTKISVDKTVAEVQKLLAKAGARAVLSEYDGYGNISSVCFKMLVGGSEVRDFDEVIGVVYYDREDGEYRAKSSDGDSFELADSSCDLKVLGHILSNPELSEAS